MIFTDLSLDKKLLVFLLIKRKTQEAVQKISIIFALDSVKNSKNSNNDVLVNSCLTINEYYLQKRDSKGRVLQFFDLRKVPEIVVGKQRVYGCIIIAILFVYIGIVGSYFYFSDPEKGLTSAIITGGLGMLALWIAKDTYQYFIAFTYIDRPIIFSLQDGRDKIEKFLEKIQQSVQSENPKLIIRNMMGNDEDEDEDKDN